MHESTFKSLQEVFGLQRVTETTVNVSAQDVAPPHETLSELITQTRTLLHKLEQALTGVISSEVPTQSGRSREISIVRSLDSSRSAGLARDDTCIIDGVFDGKQMIADDGALYPVPENYASKSKLVEGDLLQRAAMPDGRAYFKQVSRVARTTITARLERVDTESGIAAGSNGKTYNLLHSPLRFFRVTPGDTITLEVPLDGGSWAAVVGKTETCYTESRYARLVPHA